MSKRKSTISKSRYEPPKPNKVSTNYYKQLSDECICYIMAHYKMQPRSQLMRKVGMSNRYVFNQIIMELGLAS